MTAEATPHHFTLTHERCEGYDTNAKMSPPLREDADREARQHLDDVLEIRVTSFEVRGAERLGLRDHRLGDHVEPLPLRGRGRRDAETLEVLHQVLPELVEEPAGMLPDRRARLVELAEVETKELGLGDDEGPKRQPERLADRFHPFAAAHALARRAERRAEPSDLLGRNRPQQIFLVPEVDVERRLRDPRFAGDGARREDGWPPRAGGGE